jgi:hypothetical protein
LSNSMAETPHFRDVVETAVRNEKFLTDRIRGK